MKILYLSHRVPFPPDKGDRLRAFHILRRLGQRHELHLLALADGGTATRDTTELAKVCTSIELFPLSGPARIARSALAVLSGRPLTLSYFRSRALWLRVRELSHIGGFDAVVAYCSSMAPYAVAMSCPRVLDLVDVDSAKWSEFARRSRLPGKLVFALEAHRLRRYESGLGTSFARVAVTTERELKLIGRICPSARAVVVRNGIDLSYFKRGDLAPARNPRLIFTGQMDYFPNIDGVTWFATSVLPRLQRRFPTLELVIVGRRPTARVTALGSLPGVEVTGEVDDIRPYLESGWAFVAPLRIARGVQNKVLEAMAMGLPVVCSSEAFGGLADGGFHRLEDLGVADSPAEWTRALTNLLDSAELRARMAAAARGRLEATYSWERNTGLFEQLLQAVAGADSPRGVLGKSQAAWPSRRQIGVLR